MPLLDSGDPIAARMAFKEEYTRLLAVARRERTPPCWTLTPGSDPDQREQVVTEAATQGLISAEYAAKLLPYHQPPTPAGQALLEAAVPPKRFLEPALPETTAPPVPVAERLAALRAAVTGAPAWSPPPKATPRPPLPPAAPARRRTEAGSRSQSEREPALATEATPV